MSGVAIAEFSMRDYDEVIALWRASSEGVGLSAADAPERIATYLARNPGMSFTAREEQTGRLAGAVLCGHDGRRGYLHHLAVRPDLRGRGIGRALAGRCLDALAREGIDKCHLFVFRENQAGIAFWEHAGWKERGDLLVMSHPIDCK